MTQDFSKIRAMIEYVDNMPLGTKFDYALCDHCLFGHGIPNEIGMTNYDFIFAAQKAYPEKGMNESRAELFGLTEHQFDVLYTQLTVDESQRHNRREICALARAKVAEWETEDIIKTCAAEPVACC